MIKTIVLFLFAITCYAPSFAQKITPNQVPGAVGAGFRAKFPLASQDSWAKENDSTYEVQFFNNKKRQSALFDKSGKWLETENETNYNQLPRPVQQALDKQFYGFLIQEAYLVETADKGTIYEISIYKGRENYEVTFSPKGDLLKKEAGDKED